MVSPNGVNCFTNSYEGAGRNYGSDGSLVNYQEVMNRALDKAIISVLDTPQVRDALCGQCPVTADQLLPGVTGSQSVNVAP